MVPLSAKNPTAASARFQSSYEDRWGAEFLDHHQCTGFHLQPSTVDHGLCSPGASAELYRMERIEPNVVWWTGRSRADRASWAPWQLLETRIRCRIRRGQVCTDTERLMWAAEQAHSPTLGAHRLQRQSKSSITLLHQYQICHRLGVLKFQKPNPTAQFKSVFQFFFNTLKNNFNLVPL